MNTLIPCLLAIVMNTLIPISKPLNYNERFGMKRPKTSQKVIGYTRVSSHRQEDQGSSLEAQAESIREWAHANAKELVSICSDTASARGPFDKQSRPGLTDAIRQAVALSLPIVVSRTDRLCRDISIVNELDSLGVRVISLETGKTLGKNEMRKQLRSAQDHVGKISDSALRSAEHSKSTGVALGNRTNLPLAQRRGSIANGLRTDKKSKELADFLENHPGWEQMTLKNLAETLNIRGVLNLKSEKHSVRKPWTVGSLRKPLGKAKDELTLRRELDAEDAFSSIAESSSVTKIDDRQAVLSSRYEDNPNFGIF